MIISGYHDYRSKRRANLHFIADELVKRGDVFFFSLRYSHLTRRREDPRHDLWDRANQVERVGGVDCYLWRTPIHPFRLPARLRLAERALFGLFARHLPRPARARIARATHIFVESGIGIVYLPLLRRLNPTGQIIYMASDSLAAINQAETIKQAFQRHAHLVDSARLPSPYLRDDVPASIPCYFIPHGIEKEKFARIGPSPYRPGTTNAVSVGSMLFDNTFFEIAGPAFPDITFHVIGSGHKGESTANVIYYDEMPFEATLPYLKHANFAIAAYGISVAPYLTHTSMKLMQYGYLGLPAVCPEVVAGEGLGRVGYTRLNPESIRISVEAVLPHPDVPKIAALDWAGVAERLLQPEVFDSNKFSVLAHRKVPARPQPDAKSQVRPDSLATHVVDAFLYRLTYLIVSRSRRVGQLRSPLFMQPSDVIGCRLISTGSFESTQIAALDQLITDSNSLTGLEIDWRGCFIDVGANIGVYTVRYSHLFTKTIAIEPNPATFHALTANVLLSRCNNVHPICVGASNSYRTARLNVSTSGMLGWSRLGDDAGWETYPVDVELNTVDNIVTCEVSDDRVALVKIDVEGHELEVIEGAAKTLARHHPVVLFEVLSEGLGTSSAALLQSLGYDRFFTFERKISIKSVFGSLPIVARSVNPRSLPASALVFAVRQSR